jgi:hypothetical protein
MLYTIAVILVILWLLGMVTSYTHPADHCHHFDPAARHRLADTGR